MPDYTQFLALVPSITSILAVITTVFFICGSTCVIYYLNPLTPIIWLADWCCCWCNLCRSGSKKRTSHQRKQAGVPIYYKNGNRQGRPKRYDDDSDSDSDDDEYDGGGRRRSRTRDPYRRRDAGGPSFCGSCFSICKTLARLVLSFMVFFIPLYYYLSFAKPLMK